MSDIAFKDFTEKAQTLSYEQTLSLMQILLQNLQKKSLQKEYNDMENDVIQHSMNNVWEELKNDTW